MDENSCRSTETRFLSLIIPYIFVILKIYMVLGIPAEVITQAAGQIVVVRPGCLYAVFSSVSIFQI
jgi:hypothetical protein